LPPVARPAREYPPGRSDSQPSNRTTGALLRGRRGAGYDGVMSPPETRSSSRPAGATHISAPREPQWPDAVAECRRILAGLIAIDTSNPPGREMEAVRTIEALLAREGIAGRTFEAAPGRGNFGARVAGPGAQRPLRLTGPPGVVG